MDKKNPSAYTILIVVVVFLVLSLQCCGSTFTGTTTTSAGFIWPIASLKTYISSPFGPRINPVTHQFSTHDGIDIAGAGINEHAVSCAAAGTVSKIVSGDRWYGNYIIVDHGKGLQTFYGHLCAFAAISVGKTVAQGQCIGFVGSTGNSTGPHLHFGVIQGGKYVDPESFSYQYMNCSNFK